MSMLNIMLVEDNRGDVLLVRESLREYQIEHQLFVCHDGEQALEYVVRMGKPNEPPCPDLMLLDLNLPKADGATVLSEFRRHPECVNMPVIVVTSSDSPKDRDRLAKLGVSYYFRKPTDYDEYLRLGGVVQAVMKGRDDS